MTLCGALKALEEHRLYLELGYPTVAAYAEDHFDYRRTETYEAIRVSRALDALPRCGKAFAEGGIGWSKLKLVTRIATAGTEEAWLEHARTHTVEQVEAEVRDAIDKKRDTPRSDRYGLPNLELRLVLKFTRSEMEKVRLGLGRLEEEVAAKTGADDVPLRDLLLYVCERLASGGTEELEARSSDAPLPYAVVYHRCPACEASGIWTRDGLVEVEAEEVDRVQGDAHVEHVGAEPVSETREDDAGPAVDRPTPPKMRRQILLRDGQTCANPHCRNAARHCHHIVLRSEGGRTELTNEIALCTTCHALVHAGLLKVTGRPGESLAWTTMAASLGAELGADGPGSEALPVVRIPSGYADGARPGSAAPSAGPSPEEEGGPGRLTLPRDVLRDLIAGLVDQGFDKQTARHDLLRAAAELPPGRCTEKTLLEAAYEYRRERKRAARRVSGDIRIPVGLPHPAMSAPSARPDIRTGPSAGRP